ncbi:MAG: PH domain-containing protein [Longimicrobiales bacterium]
MADSDREVLWEAEFNPKVRTYWLLSGALVLLVTLVGIVALPFWFLLGHYFTGRYLSHMRCTLTPKTLEVAKGMFVRVEKTVPLDKITDVGVVHGPVMRYLGLQALSVETAGQSSAGALVKLTGIVDNEDFRAAVLAQRDRVVETVSAGETVAALPAVPSSSDAVLVEIRDVLNRIEAGLADRP